MNGICTRSEVDAAFDLLQESALALTARPRIQLDNTRLDGTTENRP
jgi:hypothetical protein